MMYSLSLRVLEKEKSLATCHSKTPTQFDRSILVHGFADSIHCVQLNVKCSKCGVRNKPTHTHIHQMEQLRWGIGEKIQYYWIWTLAAFFIKRDSFKSGTPIVSIHTENIYTHTHKSNLPVNANDDSSTKSKIEKKKTDENMDLFNQLCSRKHQHG